MLKPYACVACEKVILAKDNGASLISLFNKIVLIVPTGAEIPKNAVSPYQWAVFSIWDTEPGDELKQYVLCTQILYPDGTQFAEIVKQNIVIEPAKRAQMVAQFIGFPVGQLGDYTVLTWIELEGHKVFGPIDFKLGVELLRQEPSPAKVAN